MVRCKEKNAAIERRYPMFWNERESERIIKQSGEKVIPVLIELLTKTEDVDTQKKVMTILGEFGEVAKSSVPTLLNYLHHAQEELCMTSALSLSKIGSTSIPCLDEMIQKTEGRPKFWATWAWTLLHVDKNPDNSLRMLRNMYKQAKSEYEQIAVEEALGKIMAQKLAATKKE